MWILAFTMGITSSLHCLGMCGPLAMACPVTGPKKSQILASRLAYHGSRILMYSAIGSVLGLIGEAFKVAGWHQFLSIVLGLLILLYLMVRWLGFKVQDAYFFRLFLRLKKPFNALILRRNLASIALLGLLNGLLPCAMVYLAGTMALANGHWVQAMLFMLAFGLGTTPLLLLAAEGFRWIKNKLNFAAGLALPVLSALTGLLLIFRGLNAGLPWISPEIFGWAGEAAMCR